MRNLFYLALTLTTFFVSCSDTGFLVKGELEDAADLSVYFDQVNPVTNTNHIIAKSQANSKGVFSIPLEEVPAPGLYRIRLGAKTAYVILDGTEKNVTLKGSLADISNYSYIMEGSTQSSIFAEKMNAVATRSMNSEQLSKYIINEASPLVAMMLAMRRFNDPQFAPLHVELSKKLNQDIPEEQITKEYQSYATAINREYQRQKSLARVQVGQEAPEISLPGVDGKERKLSDLKGNVVLLDFWASWCGPCRKENPHVVSIYDKYKDQGFTVFSVSLDGLDTRTKSRFPADQLENQMQAQKQRWVSAIKKDKLKWDHHVSDLKKWESDAASTYGITSIPRTFLLDREGKIAAVNPRRNLEEALSKLL